MQDADDLLNSLYSTTVSEILVLVREVRVRVGVLATPVRIRIYRDARNAEPYVFELSAAMQTSPEAGRASEGRAASEAEALRRAVRLLTQDYDAAVRQGRMPDDSWLVPATR